MRSLFAADHRAAECIAVFLVSIFAACAGAAEQVPPYEAKVIVPGAQVLSGPGADFYAVDTLSEGEIVEVHRQQPGGWLGIRPPEDSFSWVFGRHVKLLDDGLAQVEKDDVASRIGSRMSDQRNAVQVRLKKDEIVEVLGEQSSDGQTWYKIAPPPGEFRWIHTRHVAQIDVNAPMGATPTPVITVPISDDPAAQTTPPITLIADSQPAAGDNWRSAPADAAAPPHGDGATANVAAPLLAPDEQVVRGSPDPAPSHVVQVSPDHVVQVSPDHVVQVSPDHVVQVSPDHVVRGSPDPAPAASEASSNPVAPPSPTTGPISEGLARQLSDLEMRLSRVVAEPPATWQIEPLAAEAQRLLAQAQASSDRSAVQTTANKIDRFAEIGRRYRQIGSLGAGSGDPRTTGLGDPRTTGTTGSGDLRTTPGAASGGPRTTFSAATQPGLSPITPLPGVSLGTVGPDGQRYDAVGVLRPVVSKRPGAPQFALLNERGQVVSFVTPSPDVNLQPYVGRRIGVTGSRGYIPEFQRSHVTAGRVSPLGGQLLR
jgi:hypothetical protein